MQYRWCICGHISIDIFPGGTVVKNPPARARDARDAGLIPGSGRSPRIGNGNPLQYSCLENSIDSGAWWATVHGVAKSQTRLSIHTHSFIHFTRIFLSKVNQI